MAFSSLLPQRVTFWAHLRRAAPLLLAASAISTASPALALGRAASREATSANPSSLVRTSSRLPDSGPSHYEADRVGAVGAPLAEASASGRDHGELSKKRNTFREQWLLAAEGVTHAPIDVGVQLGMKTPFGLRLSGGIGWVPVVFVDVLTGVAASASDDAYAEAVFENGRSEGRTWRLQFGVQPFKNIGLYLDAGYSRLEMSGSLSLSETEVPELVRLGGAYTAETRLHLWLLELGYQTQFAERIVAALALGVVGTFDANTTFTRQDGAAPAALLAEIARTADSAIESYGIVPTLTLRLGFDLL